MKNPKTHIVIHHSGTLDGKSLSLQAMRRFHTSYRKDGNIIDPVTARRMIAQGIYVEKPWRDIGYNFIVELVNDEYEVMLGRMINDTGAHCYQMGMNRVGIGIVAVGNFDLELPPESLWQKLVELNASLSDAFNIPVEHVTGHYEHASYKTCPGKMFDMDKFRYDVRRKLTN